MSDIQQQRLARWERIRNAGMLRFVLTRTIAFAVPFGILVFISPPPLRWQILVLLVSAAALIWSTAMWFFTMWIYSRARKSAPGA